jgi:hypothetical protein
MWAKVLQSGDIAVDATSGNGHDALFLAQLVLTPSSGSLYAFDIQEEALRSTKITINTHLPDRAERVVYLHQSHADFPTYFSALSIKLFVYNLGYLPGANKALTTITETTLKSIQNACTLLAHGGLISVTCYPGHPEGAMEEAALLDWCESLDKQTWSVSHHRWMNRKSSPSLLLLQKNGN